MKHLLSNFGLIFSVLPFLFFVFLLFFLVILSFFSFSLSFLSFFSLSLLNFGFIFIILPFLFFVFLLFFSPPLSLLPLPLPFSISLQSKNLIFHFLFSFLLFSSFSSLSFPKELGYESETMRAIAPSNLSLSGVVLVLGPSRVFSGLFFVLFFCFVFLFCFFDFICKLDFGDCFFDFCYFMNFHSFFFIHFNSFKKKIVFCFHAVEQLPITFLQLYLNQHSFVKAINVQYPLSTPFFDSLPLLFQIINYPIETKMYLSLLELSSFSVSSVLSPPPLSLSSLSFYNGFSAHVLANVVRSVVRHFTKSFRSRLHFPGISQFHLAYVSEILFPYVCGYPFLAISRLREFFFFQKRICFEFVD